MMTQAAEDSEKIYVFPLAGEFYGVPLASVGEVTQADGGDVAPVLGSRTLLGLVSLRGRVTPLLDARKALGLKGGTDLENVISLLICKNGAYEAAIATDGLGTVAAVAAGELEQADQGPVKHTFKYKDGAAKLLDVKVLFEAAAAAENGTPS